MVKEVTMRFDGVLSLARKMIPLNKLIIIRARLMIMSILNIFEYSEIKRVIFYHEIQ